MGGGGIAAVGTRGGATELEVGAASGAGGAGRAGREGKEGRYSYTHGSVLWTARPDNALCPWLTPAHFDAHDLPKIAYYKLKVFLAQC